MATTKRASKPKGGPAASRPIMPPDYGLPKDKKGLLPWSHVTERMAKAKHYWVCTADRKGRPHSTPVDGIWMGDRLYFGGSPKTRRHRNLSENPAVCIHLENAMDVVILYGEAHELHLPDPANPDLAIKLSKASIEKYGYGPDPEMYNAGGVFVFSPQKVLAWSQFPKDATRWSLTV